LLRRGLNLAWYNNASDIPSATLIEATDPLDKSSADCLLPLFISADHPDLAQINVAAAKNKQKVTSLPIQAKLYLVSGHTGGTIVKDIKGIQLAFLISDRDSCKQKRKAWKVED